MAEEEIGFKLLEVNRIERGTGRKIYKFQCLICREIFANHKNAKDHVERCKKSHMPTSQKSGPIDQYFIFENKEEEESGESETLSFDFCSEFGFPEFVPALMNLIAECNIPFSQMDHPAWEELFKSLNPTATLPCSQTIKSVFIQYADRIKTQSLTDMKNSICGIAVDGTTYREKHYYATILIGVKKIRLLQIKEIEVEDAENLSKFLKDIYEECKEFKIKISGVCSDNGPGIKAALTKNHPLCFQALIGDAVFWLSCSAHTSQLAINDFLKNNKELKTEVDKIVELVKWIEKRDSSFKDYCSCKLPHYICTRWNTLSNVIEAFLKEKENIQKFITETAKFEQERYNEKVRRARKPENIPIPRPPPIEIIPEWWNEFYEAIVIIRNFTDAVEGDLVFQQDLWKAYKEVQRSFDEISESNAYAKALQTFFNLRFVDTCNIEVAHLAYVLTAEGLTDFRETHVLDSDEFYSDIGSLKGVLISIAMKAFSKKEISEMCLLGLFDWYIKYAEFDTGENLYSYWRQMATTTIKEKGTNSGCPTSLKPFAEIALVIVTMPCTEAVCERAFSQMKTILTDLNGNLSTDMFIAEATVKLAMKYKRKYK